MKTKEFDAAIVASITTGVALFSGGFSALHECAEWVMGHPIWTHEFADKALWEKLRQAVLNQIPGMPTECASGKHIELAAEIRGKFHGGIVKLRQGCEVRAEDPVQSLLRIKEGQP